MRTISFQVAMYHTKPFDLSVRKSFSFKGNPYRGENDPNCECCKYLRDLGVVFYRDKWHGEGVIWQSDTVNISLPFDGFQSVVKLEANQLTKEAKVSEWFSRGVTSPVYKDRYAWIVFNSPVKILKITPTEVSFAKKPLPIAARGVKDERPPR